MGQTNEVERKINSVSGASGQAMVSRGEGQVEEWAEPTLAQYGEMSVIANQVVTIETADIPNAFKDFSAGDTKEWSFVAGKTGAITAYADYSGTVAGTIKATSAAHGLVTGDIITIRGTVAPNDYNGVYEITKIGDNDFYFTNAGWNADAGASDWEMGAYLLPDAGAAGAYEIHWTCSLSEGGAAGSVVIFSVYQNTTNDVKINASRKFSNNDLGSVSGCGIITIAALDRIWFAFESDGVNDLTVRFMNLVLHEI